MSKEQTPKLCVHCHCPIDKCEWGCIKYGKMSKEQTPITAEELFSKIWEMINDDDNRRKELSISTRTILDIEHKIDEAFNAKVLEALEGHIVGFVTHSANEDLSEDYKGYNEFVNLVKNYIETEVKPKYKL